MPLPRTCLLVGGSGFIGSHLARHLQHAGVGVRVVCRNREKARRNLASCPQAEIVRADISDSGCHADILDGIDAVLYLAHGNVPATSGQDLAGDLIDNTPALIRFCTTVADTPDIRHVMYLSSGGTVYGDPAVQVPLTETHPTNPISSYGLTKLIGEQYVRLCLNRTDIHRWILRVSNVYGPGQDLSRPQGAVGHFLNAIDQGQPIRIFGDGSSVRDYIHIADLTDVVLRCLAAPVSPHDLTHVLNVGSGIGTSLRELIDLTQAISGRPCRVEHRPPRAFDCDYNVLDISQISSMLDWTPHIPLHEGIAGTWAAMQEGKRIIGGNAAA